MKHSPHMQAALEEAHKAYDKDEIPIGAVIVDSATGEIIARSGNRTEELSNPIAHAEMLVIEEACRTKGEKRLTDCDIYTTLEPCPMCAQAIAFARLRRVYFGANDEKGGGVENGPRIFSQPTCNHQPEIYSGIQETECSDILKKFFQKRRS